MDLANLDYAKTSLRLSSRLRLLVWAWIPRRGSGRTSLDPARLSEHMRQDLGLQRPNLAWEESVGFWRDR